MYNNFYGSQVFKRYQIQMGTPVKLKYPSEELLEVEKEEETENQTAEDEVQAVLEQAQKEAENIINEAKIKAEEIINDAKRRGKEHAAEVEQKAKEEGYRRGEELAQKHYQDLIKEAEFIRQHAQAEYNEIMHSIEKDAVKMILDISKKVIGMEIRDNPETILSIIRETFEASSQKDNIVLRVSDEDYEYVVKNKDKLFENITDMRELKIVKDKKLSKGSCLVESRYGIVDGSWETKFENLEKAFLNLVGKE